MDQNKTGKYLKYAIGEIILVVIGILIALQINNWNENRKSLISEKATLTKFLQDLQSDSTFFQANINRIKDIDELHKNLFKIGVKDANGIVLKDPNYIRRTLSYNPIAKENDPDITAKVNDDTIREGIQNYFRKMTTAKVSSSQHINIILKMRDFLRRKRSHKLEAWFESNMNLSEDSTNAPNIITSENLIELSKDVDFQQLLFESSIKLNETKVRIGVLIDSNTNLMTTIRAYIND
ncbi:DUF6090 family protein [Winogradskyella immobilis]|uniref:Uncharacterized protein n=1 Tax=Winogradskyella immobilis TaxID=2816852 RepID=A0ABS8EP60_9FLAO|nr:DUF6090 family protein [Winogradskyella immobilis]MCC1485003.1 hypothetical protein [Winogradskyella immobilis]MCG0017095.1 hypothetical protein [Winogradskyella immobilis]